MRGPEAATPRITRHSATAAKAPAVRLDGDVEVDEVYLVAGHKGQPAAVAKRGGSGGGAAWRVRRDAARWRRTNRLSSG
jgi:hypothetical protein